MKNKLLLIFLLLFTSNVFSQKYNKFAYDSTFLQNSQKEKLTQYRRSVELQKGYQTYEQKYAGKNLLDEKKRFYPLGFGTNHFSKVTTGTGVWTELNPGVPRVDYLGIHFVNPDTGWACGNLGAIIKSTDGGSSWTTMQTNITTVILKVNSYNGQVVIASGFNGLILRSTDGGETWTQVTSGATGDMWGLQMINDTLGWSCGTNNSLIKTTDGGLTWQTVTTPGYTGNYWWIDFMNKDYGFIAGDGKVLRTTDGGQNWDILQAGDPQALYSVDIIDSLHIAAAGAGGTGYMAKNIYSSDGGFTWVTGGLTTFDPINCIKYLNIDTGYISMSEVGLWKTTNQGQNWALIDSTSPYPMGEYEIQFFPEENIGYDVGTALRLYKANGNLDVWHKMIINDDFSDVFFTSEQKGFILRQGYYGILFRTTDGGMSLDTILGVPGGGCITFTDSLTGYIGTTTSKIYKTTNGGENWYQTNGITNVIAKIFFINHQTGWAAGASRIFKTTDSGENWFEQEQLNSDSFSSIYFVDSLNGWATSRYIWQTTNGGNNWIERTDIPIYFTTDVYFSNANVGWVSNDFPPTGLYRTTNSGINWSIVPGVITPYNFDFFPSPSHWILNGSHVYITIDSGSSWNDITMNIPAGFNQFQAPTDLVGFAVGPGGLILRYNDTTFTPVELVSFSAKYSGNRVALTWETATETNNRGFEVERLQDYKIEIFKDWESIGFVTGKGTSTQPETYSFVDQNVSSGTYKYRLKQIDFDGSFKYSKEIEINVNIPLQYSLSQNYPNPFNPTTNIIYTIPKETNVIIRLYDITGREIKELVNERKQPGEYTLKLKGGNLSSGIYFYRLTTRSGYTAVKKLILLK